MKTKILFLYTEIAEYFLSCIEELNSQNAEIHIVRWSVKSEAPFKFREIEGVNIYEKNTFTKESLLEFTKKINPDIIITSGWIDKDYLHTVKYFFKEIPTVLSLDNHYTASLKQKIATFISPFYLKKMFSHAWVPGKPQKEYALKLGFPEKNIQENFYSADFKLFDKYFENTFSEKIQNFPKKFIFLGRYIEQKWISGLWNAFIELQNENPNEWELISVGAGTLFEERVKHEKIHHKGFIQPAEMQELIQEAGVYVLPSVFEPWGVSLHEFAISGFPLICSDAVGSATKFVEDNKNGYIFESQNKESLKRQMKKIMSLSDSQLIEMAKQSHEISKQITPKIWTETLFKFIK